jgi:ABC-2 type transport system permease protein
MRAIIRKEVGQFFSSLIGYIAVGVFLLVCGLLLMVIPSNSIMDFNIVDYGYASMEKFFKLAPWVLLLLVPAITMRLLADEFKQGTFEILKTKPLSNWNIVIGKFWGAFVIGAIAVLPTLVYLFVIKALSTHTGLDRGVVMGSYIGLFFLLASFVAIGLFCSSLTNNSVVAFLLSVLLCFLMYFFFTAVSKIDALSRGLDYYLDILGLDFHYRNISRGIIDTRDIIYFLVIIFVFLLLTVRNLQKR